MAARGARVAATPILAAFLAFACLISGGLFEAQRSGQSLFGGSAGVFSISEAFNQMRAPSGNVPLPGDTPVYLRDARFMQTGRVPYRDFTFEYPPLAAAVFYLPYALGGAISYAQVFLVLMALCAGALGACIALIARALGRRPLRPVLITLALLTIGSPVLAWRFDLAVAALVALSVLALVRSRPGAAGLWLGLGVALKLYPVVLIPAFFLLAGRGRRASFVAGAALLALLPFAVALVWGGNPLGFLAYNTTRGLHVESLLGGIAYSLHSLLGSNPKILNDFGSYNLHSSLANSLEQLAAPIFVALFVMALAWARRAARTSARSTESILPLAGYLAVLAFMLGNKVFSPQYLAWLLPFAAFLPKPAAIATLVGAVLTTLVYPLGYALVVSAQPLGAVLIGLRNLTFLVAFVLVWLHRPLLHEDPKVEGDRKREEYER